MVVDGANVVGSRPDGWWRDRPGAARRLAQRLVDALDGPGAHPHVHLVLEGAAARATDLPSHPGLTVVRAPADGDAAIVERAVELGGTGVVVVTADRGLRVRVRAVGATTTGPRALLDTVSEPPTG
ncbi:hypothetical protein [Pseudonocardia sp.]|uniref:hypothetical protein n=1 Tax=Pseudonocardia sp. TaxID=60912 RepID=UPI002638BB9F|nr:hypothetical protein [Pseudonocardia sp.]